LALGLWQKGHSMFLVLEDGNRQVMSVG